ncbi:Uncharacterized protein OBRU01_01689 [Operophtera brumata]|uniref:Uncharacterized protein n=1 Tax=Operophtera brumata TaxID=104452 RepID=A0A0L7LTP1_OPEBR|nr:Uncharacterized protein OBRU01_01689 [Operophtera brumata]
MRSAQRRQRRLAFHCPLHGDFYPLSPQNTRKYSRKGMASVLGAPLSPEQTFGSINCPPFKEDSKCFEDNIPNAVIIRPDFDCGTATCNYRVVECKLTTTDEINRAPTTPSVHMISDSKQNNIKPSSISISIRDEGKG